ncbi:MAG: NAD-dependent deacetylase [Nitratiruptor sp.]|nr:NAD-dependent deacetylase [Nitratiruptor sp.]NPA83680.1 NAD-dependent deacetylase [Campylobacterota bacterium]
MFKELDEAVRAIREASFLLISAGAGMGVDSGLPDFRGREGFWRAYPIAKKLGLSFAQLANPRWFQEDPSLAWAFYGHRLQLYRTTKPHQGFFQLLEIARRKRDYFVLTSNVDGHFQKAGYAPHKIYEVHGSIHYLQCTTPCQETIWSADKVQVTIDMERFKAQEPLPRCPFCHAIARPNILMFGDWAWIDSRAREQEEHFASFLNRAHGDLVIVEIGAGTGVPTIRMMDEEIQGRFQAPLIRINPAEPEGATIPLPLRAKEAIAAIYERLQSSPF